MSLLDSWPSAKLNAPGFPWALAYVNLLLLIWNHYDPRQAASWNRHLLISQKYPGPWSDLPTLIKQASIAEQLCNVLQVTSPSFFWGVKAFDLQNNTLWLQARGVRCAMHHPARAQERPPPSFHKYPAFGVCFCLNMFSLWSQGRNSEKGMTGG